MNGLRARSVDVAAAQGRAQGGADVLFRQPQCRRSGHDRSQCLCLSRLQVGSTNQNMPLAFACRDPLFATSLSVRNGSVVVIRIAGKPLCSRQ